MAETRRGGPGRRDGDLYDKWNSRVRDVVLFLVGVSGCVYEIFLVPDPRPSILVFLGSLIGMPFVLSADEKRINLKERNQSQDGDDS